jgi:beta-glucosidase
MKIKSGKNVRRPRFLVIASSFILLQGIQMNTVSAESKVTSAEVEQRVAELISTMTLAEKLGQMNQKNAAFEDATSALGEDLRSGRIGSILNLVDVDVVNELQRIAVEESRLGIPLLVGRDVIHGFKTVMPIPLGQAATWNPGIVREGARVAALEASASGINWTFAPMIDISRDARWGRIAESLGEDPFLASELGVAMVEGFQGDDPAAAGSIAACAKHFAGYGAAEAGRDYSATNIPENELRNIYLRPFEATVKAGVMTLMASFSDLDGVPASGNRFLMTDILREEWRFDGFVVSDWDSVRQLQVHGLTANEEGSAMEAVNAGIDMEMEGGSYVRHLEALIEAGKVDASTIDAAVANILRAKFRLGLFDNPYADPAGYPEIGGDVALEAARQAALQSVVLLKNEGSVLPLSADTLDSVAVIGPLADAPYEQLGTWVFDGDPAMSVTPREAIESFVGDDVSLRYVEAMSTSRSHDTVPFDDAVTAASESDVAILFLGEEAILSGEAHSRADISLPGAQAELVRRVRGAGKPVIAVILAGRPLTLTNIVDQVDAILFAWHPGTMGGPAIADLLFGVASPSGKLPATFPNAVGQIPIYYNQKNTGKPATEETVVHIDDIDEFAPQTSVGNTSFHLDAGYLPLFPFGYGLSYGEFQYDNISVSEPEITPRDTLTVGADLMNSGPYAAEEVVQFYIRDLVGSTTRPVRELKGFQRVRVEPGQTVRVEFDLHTSDLEFYRRDNTRGLEPGDFHVWIGGSSATDLRAQFKVVE